MSGGAAAGVAGMVEVSSIFIFTRPVITPTICIYLVHHFYYSLFPFFFFQRPLVLPLEGCCLVWRKEAPSGTKN